MGRPSNRDERHKQVMLAFVRCVARFGLDGATLSAIADEAGLTRPLIRHHLGNRDEMIVALQDYVLEQFVTQTDHLLSALPETKPASALVEALFSRDFVSSPELVLAFAALTARASDDENLREACRAAVLDFENRLTKTLLAGYPGTARAHARITAHGITALYFNVTALAPLNMPTTWQSKARTLAHTMCKDLEG